MEIIFKELVKNVSLDSDFSSECLICLKAHVNMGYIEKIKLYINGTNNNYSSILNCVKHLEALILLSEDNSDFDITFKDIFSKNVTLHFYDYKETGERYVMIEETKKHDDQEMTYQININVDVFNQIIRKYYYNLCSLGYIESNL